MVFIFQELQNGSLASLATLSLDQCSVVQERVAKYWLVLLYGKVFFLTHFVYKIDIKKFWNALIVPVSRIEC